LIALSHVWLLPLAMVLDAIVGDPAFLWRRGVPHPVVWMGEVIAQLERRLNDPKESDGRRRAAGVATVVIIAGGGAALGYGLEALFVRVPFGWIGTAVVAAILLAGRSLYDHVAAVGVALRGNGLKAGRDAGGLIVGRDTRFLDASGVARAAIESLAESFSDGVIGPAFWFLVLGLPGIAAYKAINTADSMIGHRSERYADFGWAAARLDDLVNLPASRLAAVMIALAAPLAGVAPASVFQTTRRDAPMHRSPNAGWPEAAMAATLSVRLGGPKTYGGERVEDAVLNPAGRDADGNDIRRALRVYLGAAAIFTGVLAAAGLAALLL
jgi:adenosylcobinamide-phosphate synthase